VACFLLVLLMSKSSPLSDVSSISPNIFALSNSSMSSVLKDDNRTVCHVSELFKVHSQVLTTAFIVSLICYQVSIEFLVEGTIADFSL